MTVDLSKESRLLGFNAKEYWERRLGTKPSLRDVGYSSLGIHYNNWLYKLRKIVVRRQITALGVDISNAKVLDIGSGTGFYIELWRELGARSISGCDLTQASVRYLRERYPKNSFYQLDIGEELTSDIPSGFDVISAFDVLFHIVDDDRFDRAISNIAQLLSNDGVFCFTDLFLHGETQRASHQVSRSLFDVERTLARARLEIMDRRPVFVLMNQPLDTKNAVLRSLWRVLMYPVSRSEQIGAFCGAALYPIDRVLTKVLSESPTTEIMTCRKSRRI